MDHRGPQPIARDQRHRKVLEIGAHFRKRYGDQVLAMGVYGSHARREDGPYSDIEMHCVLKDPGVDESFEWSAGAWKAEVDVISQDLLLAQAARMDVDWSITHGAYTRVWVLYDPESFFPRLAQAASSQSEAAFQSILKDVIVGEIYELIGKIRNTFEFNEFSSLPYFTVHLAQHAACLVGLAQRHIYTSSARMFRESLSLPDRPNGYDAIIELVMQGSLTDPAAILRLANAFWKGVEQWAEQKKLIIVEGDQNGLYPME